MKQIIIALFLVLNNCNTTKAQNDIDKSVYEMWRSYVKSNPDYKNSDVPDSWYFHNNKEDANRLAKLTLSGEKRATTSGLYAWYKEANADLPQVGTKQIVTDFDGKAIAVISTIKVDTIAFNKVPEAYAALDMGTTIAPLEKWKKAHWDFFNTIMQENGTTPTKEMLVVCEWFEVVWPEK